MNPFFYIRQYLSSILSRDKKVLKRTFHIPAIKLGRDVVVDIYRPPVPPWRLLRLVVFNDGQDLSKMNFEQHLHDLYLLNELAPTLVVGVHAGNRMREYGTVSSLDYKGRGDLAADYESFICDDLMPWLLSRYNVHKKISHRFIAGFSLGGVSAFDLAWRNSDIFGGAGIFSGSLWWRKEAFKEESPDADRILHTYVEEAESAPPLRLWFMAGSDDETEDRNKNGIIDSIDDTLQLMALLRSKGLDKPSQMTYVELTGGTHDPQSWGRVMTRFLRWSQLT